MLPLHRLIGMSTSAASRLAHVLLLVTVGTTALAGCGSATPAGGDASSSSTPSSLDPSSLAVTTPEPSAMASSIRRDVASLGPTKLTISVKETPDAPARVRTLTCNPAGGTLAAAGVACQGLANAGGSAALTPVPAKGTVCTQVMGGRATATIDGTMNGKAVSVRLSQTDGCKIAQWNALSALLGSKAGAAG